MLKLFLVVLCVTATLADTKKDDIIYGGLKSREAYLIVCWYEHLKAFPNTDFSNYGECTNRLDGYIDYIVNIREPYKAYFESRPENYEEFYGKYAVVENVHIPPEYGDSCNQYMQEPRATPPANESDAINDGGRDYPYKAFVYCLMSKLRSKYGDAAIEAVKAEKTHSKKPWMQTLLDRENEVRARHGAEPLVLDDELIEGAQHWAEVNARDCNMYHSDTPDTIIFRKLKNGDTAGESLHGGFGNESFASDSAYIAADGWYEEYKDYPFAEGYKGDGSDKVDFGKIGHFTQSVWKGTKRVGYGYKRNGQCGKSFLVGRYWPPGNYAGEYVKNVGAPK